MTQAGEVQRQRILDVVRGDPGTHVRRIALVVGLGWTSCDHHLRCLEEQGLVTRQPVRGRATIYPMEMDARHRAAVSLLRTERNARIMDVVHAEPGLSQRAVARRAGLAPSTLSRRVRSLEDAGALRRVEQGRRCRIYPTDVARPAGLSLVEVPS